MDGWLASPHHDGPNGYYGHWICVEATFFSADSCKEDMSLGSLPLWSIASQTLSWDLPVAKKNQLLLGHQPGRPPSCNHLCCRPSALQDVNPLILGPTLVIFQPLTKYRHPLILCVVNFAGGEDARSVCSMCDQHEIDNPSW